MRFLITVPENSITRNVLRSGVLLRTLTEQGHTVTLVCPPNKKEEYQKEFGTHSVTIVAFTSETGSFYERALAFLARNVFYSLSNGLFQERAAVLKESKIPLQVKKILISIFGSSHIFKNVIRFFDLHIQSEKKILDIFDELKPDIVFSTALLNPEIDVPVLREAKKRNIHTIAMTRSWDNLSSFGFMRMVPDTFLAQNEFLKDITSRLHGMELSKIEVVGEPYYDNFFNADLDETREVFCERIGVDPRKKIILYAAIGDSLFPHEGELSDVFNSLVETKAIPEDCHFIFRAHPAFSSPLERMKNLDHVIPDRGATYSGESFGLWDMNQKHVAHFINSIRHADVVVSAGSTVILDAVAEGKPVVSVAFDGLSVVDPLFSVRSYIERTTHLDAAVQTKGFRVAYDREQLAEYITLYLHDKDADMEERITLQKRFASPRDGHSTERIALALLKKAI